MTQILEEPSPNLNSIKSSEITQTQNGFSFGKTNLKPQNPFENFLYQSNANYKQESNFQNSSPTKFINKIIELNENSTDKKPVSYQDSIKPKSEKILEFEKKPPLSKNSSLKNLKQIENSMKNKDDFERIASIMKGNFGDSKKFYDFSSDSDNY